MPPGVGCSVATVAVADAVEDHPRLRFEDCRTDLFPEPVSGDADGRLAILMTESAIAIRIS